MNKYKIIVILAVLAVASAVAVWFFYPSKINNIGGSDMELQGTLCPDSARNADVCIEIYKPVCATVQIQCIRAPCDPIKQTFSNSCVACRNSLAKSYTEGVCKNTVDMENEIKQLFIQKYPKYASTVSVRIGQETETHVRGIVSFETGAPGGIFLAAKIDDKWKIVFDGNGGISCTLAKYGFPNEMLSDCK